MIFGLFLSLFMLIYTSSISHSQFSLSSEIDETRIDGLNARLDNISMSVTGTSLGTDPSIAPGSGTESSAYSKGIAAILSFANGIGVVWEGVGIAASVGIGVPPFVWSFLLIMFSLTIILLIVEFMWRYKS